MNAQLKGSFLISLSKDCLYSSGATLVLIFGLKPEESNLNGLFRKE